MAIFLFTDFGAADLYVGQVEAVLDRYAPGVRVIHLLHEAPALDVKASAHLLAALAHRIPRGSVVMGVVDPGVGSARKAAVVRADGRWFVGPDNGLFSVLAARATTRQLWRVVGEPQGMSVSFHGRDLYAPLVAAVATDDFPNESVASLQSLDVALDAADLPEIVYADHYGNALTGMRAAKASSAWRLEAAGSVVPHARVFSDVPQGTAFWYENSIGLVEIAVNGGSAATLIGLAIGDAVRWQKR